MEENLKPGTETLDEALVYRSALIQRLADAQQGTDTAAIDAALEALAACQVRINELEAAGGAS